MYPNYIPQYRLSSQDSTCSIKSIHSHNLCFCIMHCHIIKPKLRFSNDQSCICVHFAFFYDFDILFWNCSDCVVFFFHFIWRCRPLFHRFGLEEFEDSKGAIRIRISKNNRQNNGQKEKDKQRPTKSKIK